MSRRRRWRGIAVMNSLVSRTYRGLVIEASSFNCTLVLYSHHAANADMRRRVCVREPPAHARNVGVRRSRGHRHFLLRMDVEAGTVTECE